MWTKKYILIALFTGAAFWGCNENSLSPSALQADKISGETKLVKFMDLGTTKQLENGSRQISQQVAIFEDKSNNGQFSGLRNIVMNHNFDKDNYGNSFGTFSIEAKNAYWEGEWTGTTNSLGTTIKAVGYNLDERDQRGEWRYHFPALDEGKSGTYTVKIYYDKN